MGNTLIYELIDVEPPSVRALAPDIARLGECLSCREALCHRVDLMLAEVATIAGRIRWVIHARGLTQQSFAGLVQMAPSQLSVLLKRLDERPYAIELETVIRLAEAGGVTARWLLLGEGDPFGRGATSKEPVYPPLRELPRWEWCVATLRSHDFVLTDDLLDWVGDVSLPLAQATELTPDVVASLARMRLQMQYRRTFVPYEYDPEMYVRAELPPRANSRRGSPEAVVRVIEAPPRKTTRSAPKSPSKAGTKKPAGKQTKKRR